MRLEFTKMQACGNDYIYFNCFDREISSPDSLSVLLSDRHYGIGGDGIVMILRSDTFDAKMRMFNRDGSEGAMCGNAIRCVAKYLYDNGLIKKTQMHIETLSGTKSLYLTIKNELVSSVKVDMGKAVLGSPQRIVNETVIIGGTEYAITCVSMGNPHAVVFCGDTESFDVVGIGPLFENDAMFPDRTNVEFVEVIDRNRLKMRVWERGSGETLACGTGACAAAVAAVWNGYCDVGADITVELPGGEMIVNYSEETVFMTGDCNKVFDGVIDV